MSNSTSPHFPAGAIRLYERVVALLRDYKPTVRYLMETEVHVYAFSMAANVLLSFFPFLIVMVSISRYVLHWDAAEQAVYLALADIFPGETGDFLQRNLRVTVNSYGKVQVVSLLLLMFTANGIFEPLEVALNRAWGIRENRSYLSNQVLSFAMILACGGLAMASALLTALNQQIWSTLGLGGSDALAWLNLVFFKMAAVPISMCALFLIYWKLPNTNVPWQRVLPTSVAVGLLLEVLKYINLLTWPAMRAKLQHEYGPFVNSATIVLWSFLASMLVLAGADWAARTGSSDSS